MTKCLSLLLAMTSSAAVSCHAVTEVHRGVKSREVTIQVSDLALEGTLEVPSGAGKFPAMLLLPGSGPTDRNGNSGLGITTDVLRSIADELADQGIATLRFDKRAIHHYSNVWPKTPEKLNAFFAWNKFVGDAKAALSFLEAQPEIDGKHVGMLGHSEGALISLQVGSDLAGKTGAPACLVLLGSTGRPMGIIIHEQIARQLSKQGAPAAVAKPYLDYTDAATKALAAGQPIPPNCPPGLDALFNPTAADVVGAYCRIDPTDLAKNYAGPVLAINGAHDTQVSAERDTPRLVAALRSRSHGTVDSYIAPDTSHNLKSTKSGDDDAFTGPIVPGILLRIVKFLKLNLS